MKFIELFAGIGGFRLGLERAGHTCVWANEWLENPRRIYARHFGQQPDPRDVRTIGPDDLPDADLICGGFPCATFSIAGKRTGLSEIDTRGTLFFEICRLASAKRTPYVFLENVKGLLNHDSGRTFGVILFTLDKLGYDIQWEVLNSRNFGVAQNRERVFIIANLRGKPRPKVFPLGEIQEENVGIEQAQQAEGAGVREQGDKSLAIGTLCNRLYGGDTNNYYIQEPEVSQWRRGYFRKFKSNGVPTLTANMGTGGHNVPFIENSKEEEYQPKDIVDTLTAYGVPALKRNLPKLSDVRGIDALKSWDFPEVFGETNDKEKNLLQMVFANRRGKNSRYPDRDGSAVRLDSADIELAQGLVAKNYLIDDGDGWFDLARTSGRVNDSEKVFGSAKIRKLTPVECERLQGYPDNWTKYYEDGSLVADAERYERCGRTVTIPVIEAIGRKLHEFF